MAEQYDQLVGILKDLLLNRFSPKPNFVRGLLGDGTGQVEVPGRLDHTYVRFNRGANESFEVFNKETPYINGWPVLIGEFPWQPGLTQVVGTDWAAYEQSGWGDTSTTSPHAPTHEWKDGQRGADPVNIYLRAIAPFRLYSPNPSGTVVYVNAGEYHTGTIWPGTPGVDIQPIISATPTGSARFAGVYLNPDNTLGVVTGTTDSYTPAFDPPLVNFPFGTIPIGRVKLYGGQTGVRESDFRDARRLFDFPATGTPLPLYLQQINAIEPITGQVIIGNGGTWQGYSGTAAQAAMGIVLADYLRADGTVTGSVSQAQSFGANGIETDQIAESTTDAGITVVDDLVDAPLMDSDVYDFSLQSTAAGVENHFKEGTVGTPTGWTANTAALVSSQAIVYSRWQLNANAANPTWDYSIQSSINLESAAASSSHGFQALVMFSDPMMSADAHFYFKIHPNNAGSPNTAIYSGVDIYWDATAGLWKIQGQEHDGAVAVDGGYQTITYPYQIPFYIRVRVRFDANKSTGQYIRSFTGGPDGRLMSRLQTANPTTPPTWGDIHVRFHHTHGGGTGTSVLQILSLDYNNEF